MSIQQTLPPLSATSAKVGCPSNLQSIVKSEIIDKFTYGAAVGILASTKTLA